MTTNFTASHGSATDEKVLAAATDVEVKLGLLLSGDKKAFNKLNVEHLVLLIQFARDTIREKSPTI